MQKQRNYHLGSRSLSDNSIDTAVKGVIMLFMCQFRDYIKAEFPDLGFRIRPEGLIITRITQISQVAYINGYTLPGVFEVTDSTDSNRTLIFSYIGQPDKELEAWKSLGAALNIFKEYLDVDWTSKEAVNNEEKVMLECLAAAKYILQR